MVALFHFRFGVEFHNQTRRFDHPLARADEGFHDDGQIGVEVFVSNGGVRDEALLEDLFKEFGE